MGIGEEGYVGRRRTSFLRPPPITQATERLCMEEHGQAGTIPSTCSSTPRRALPPDKFTSQTLDLLALLHASATSLRSRGELRAGLELLALATTRDLQLAYSEKPTLVLIKEAIKMEDATIGGKGLNCFHLRRSTSLRDLTIR